MTKKRDSILRINHFSDSESEDGQGDQVNDEKIQEEMESEEGNEKNPGESEEENEVEMEDDLGETSGVTQKKIKPKKVVAKKTGKKGIIYISQIPKHMNVTLIRELFEVYGEVGRIYLQPDNKSKELAMKKSKKKRVVNFTEGWIEFEKKKVAKWVAANINNTPISSKKGSIFYDILWSLKYLPRFKWIHLSERLTYERAVARQKMTMAVSKARKEAGIYQSNLDKSEKIAKKKKKSKINN